MGDTSRERVVSTLFYCGGEANAMGSWLIPRAFRMAMVDCAARTLFHRGREVRNQVFEDDD